MCERIKWLISTSFVKRGLASTKSSLVSKGQDEARMLKELDRIRESHNQVVRPEDAGHHGVVRMIDQRLRRFDE